MQGTRSGSLAGRAAAVSRLHDALAALFGLLLLPGPSHGLLGIALAITVQHHPLLRVGGVILHNDRGRRHHVTARVWQRLHWQMQSRPSLNPPMGELDCQRFVEKVTRPFQISFQGADTCVTRQLVPRGSALCCPRALPNSFQGADTCVTRQLPSSSSSSTSKPAYNQTNCSQPLVTSLA